MAKYTDEQIQKAFDILDKFEFFGGQRAGRERWFNKPTDIQNKDIGGFLRDLDFLKQFINRQEAEIERLREYEEIRPVGCPNCSRGNFSNSKFCSHCGTQLQGKKKDIDRELAELASEIKILTDANENLVNLYNSEKEKVAKLYEKLIEAYKKLPTAKSEAIKEFWNQRPPMLNPNFEGKEQYNKGWNDCISFFAEEYKIFLGIKKQNENDCPDTAEEMVGEGE